MSQIITPELREKKLLDKMIDAGLEAVDLFAVAQEDIITRPQLRVFLKAALKAREAGL